MPTALALAAGRVRDFWDVDSSGIVRAPSKVVELEIDGERYYLHLYKVPHRR